MICKQCGTENDPGSKFCSECGAPLPAAPAAEPETVEDFLDVEEIEEVEEL